MRDDNMNPDSASELLVSLFPNIPAGDLAMALAMAQMDPDGQEFPWRPDYPLIGATVVHDGQLWTVVRVETGPGADESTAIITLEGRAGTARATRSELRPVTWTSAQEAELTAAV